LDDATPVVITQIGVVNFPLNQIILFDPEWDKNTINDQRN
jgi:hypothetical protein